MKATLLAVALLLTASVSTAGPRLGNSHGYGYAYGRSHRYVPSTYMEWNAALELGKQQIAEQQKSLGEIAREYRARKAQEKKTVAQDSEPLPTNNFAPKPSVPTN